MSALGGIVVGLFMLLPHWVDHSQWTVSGEHVYRKGTQRTVRAGYSPYGGWVTSSPEMGRLLRKQRLANGLLLRLVDAESGVSSDTVRLGRHVLTRRRYRSGLVLSIRNVRPQGLRDVRKGGEPDEMVRRRLVSNRLLMDLELRVGRRRLVLMAANTNGVRGEPLGRGAWWSAQLPTGGRLMLRMNPKTGEVAAYKVVRH